MTIVMIADEAIAPVADITAPAWEAYARSRQLTFVRQDPQYPFGHDRIPTWGKIWTLRHRLQNTDYVAIVDADTMPLNFAAGDLLSGLTDETPVSVAQDWNGLCASLIASKSTWWSRWFFDSVWECGDTEDNRGENKHEQSAMKKLLTFDRVKSRVLLRPELHSDLRTYRAGDFLIHLPCLTTEERCRILQSRTWEKLP